MTPRRLAFLALALMMLLGLALAVIARDVPIAPQRLRELVRLDALSAVFLLLSAGAGLARLMTRPASQPLRTLVATGLLGISYVCGHLAGVAAGFLAATLVLERADSWAGPTARRSTFNVLRFTLALPLAAALCLAAGLSVIGLSSGEWRYAAPLAGSGLSSPVFALVLLAALLGAGLWALPLGKPIGPPDPLLASAFFYPLLRLYSLGPWNLGWLFATMLLGGAAMLWAAFQAATIATETAHWFALMLIGMALLGAGMGSGAGIALAIFALISLPVILVGLTNEPDGPAWPLWLLSSAAPFSILFVTVWIGVAAALAGGLSLLGVAIWAAALLSTLAVARRAAACGPNNPASMQPDRLVFGQPVYLAASLSLTLGIASPGLLSLLVSPIVSQLQGGLTPFGEIELWPWAGLIAVNLGQQPVATLPSLALVALMLILAALAWLAARLLRVWRRRSE